VRLKLFNCYIRTALKSSRNVTTGRYENDFNNVIYLLIELCHRGEEEEEMSEGIEKNQSVREVIRTMTRTPMGGIAWRISWIYCVRT
jgi:hypothetical protein